MKYIFFRCFCSCGRRRRRRRRRRRCYSTYIHNIIIIHTFFCLFCVFVSYEFNHSAALS